MQGEPWRRSVKVAKQHEIEDFENEDHIPVYYMSQPRVPVRECVPVRGCVRGAYWALVGSAWFIYCAHVASNNQWFILWCMPHICPVNHNWLHITRVAMSGGLVLKCPLSGRVVSLAELDSRGATSGRGEEPPAGSRGCMHAAVRTLHALLAIQDAIVWIYPSSHTSLCSLACSSFKPT